MICGCWIDTILYEIPILALVSEAYFRFVDTDWDYVGQYGTPQKCTRKLRFVERAFCKAERLIRGGCVFSEFGSRRRRDYHTHELVIQGLLAASTALDGPGRLQGTSNVHFAMKYNLTPIGTVAHEVYLRCRGKLRVVVHGYCSNNKRLSPCEFTRPQTLARNVLKLTRYPHSNSRADNQELL